MEVAYRLPEAELSYLAADVDPRVRFAVAERIAVSDLAPFLDDPEMVIRDVASDRLTAFSERHVTRLMRMALPAHSSIGQV
jgi:hypothetical protein